MHQAYGVLGYPLGHSLSPYLHNQAFQKLGMDRCYFKWEVKPDDLQGFFQAVRILPLSGVSVTIPYKETVMPFLEMMSREALETGSVNTIYLQEGKLAGANTDYLGFIGPLKNLNLESALVLGAGGASRAVIYGLKKLGVRKIYICNRNRVKARKIADEFQVQCKDWAERGDLASDILINTTPLGTRGDNEDQTPWNFNRFPFKIVYDLVYNPLKTRLLRQAENQGVMIASGLSMFVHQAREQFRIWTGEVFDADWAESLLREKLNSETSDILS